MKMTVQQSIASEQEWDTDRLIENVEFMLNGGRAPAAHRHPVGHDPRGHLQAPLQPQPPGLEGFRERRPLMVSDHACGYTKRVDDSPCMRPLGHSEPHRVYSPYGDGRWVEFDHDGVQVAQGGPWAPDPEPYQPKHLAKTPRRGVR